MNAKFFPKTYFFMKITFFHINEFLMKRILHKTNFSKNEYFSYERSF